MNHDYFHYLRPIDRLINNFALSGRAVTSVGGTALAWNLLLVPSKMPHDMTSIAMANALI